MKQKMIIALDSASDSQRDMITDYLRQQGGNIWHWLADVWLWADAPEDVSPKNLWTHLESLAEPGEIRGLVMTVGQESKFWGTNQPSSWDWLYRVWGRPDFTAEEWRKADYQHQTQSRA